MNELTIVRIVFKINFLNLATKNDFLYMTLRQFYMSALMILEKDPMLCHHGTIWIYKHILMLSLK